MRGVVLSIGDELVLGQVVDSNSAWLCGELAKLGVEVVEVITVGDDVGRIEGAIRRGVEMGEVVVATGGLGPTDDDLTRQAVAGVLGVELVEDEGSLREIAGFFERMGRAMAGRNRVQALRPAGARAIRNEAGTAPGIEAEFLRGDGGKAVGFFVPGVPGEMRAMWVAVRGRLEAGGREERLEAGGWRLEGEEGGVGRGVRGEGREDRGQDALGTGREEGGGGRRLVSRVVRVVGVGESNVAEALGELMGRGRRPVVNTTAKGGLVDVRINDWAADEGAGREAIGPVEAEVRRRLAGAVYGVDGETLAGAVGRRLLERGEWLAVAESCTGGLLGGAVTEAAGASGWFLGGWVTYANEAKVRELGVDAGVLERQGAVSAEVAGQMARGARERAGADWGVGITGIAGPEGGTVEKPVGLVFIGLSGPGVERVERWVFAGDRAAVRERAVSGALGLLWAVLGELKMKNEK